ncbi:MAG TPA: class I SAM-dependent methyltransferase [bacterium]|nr:class I SAM-dependent methyltransferase [bacterium]
MSEDQVLLGSERWWDEYFAPGGGWEKNRGPNQTRQFVKAFLRLVILDRDKALTLLDVGCALGHAIELIHERYPRAVLTGVDFSSMAVRRCRERLGSIAGFERRTIEEINEEYDVIYVSHLMEHFWDYRGKASHLARHCQRLIISVPYNEFGAPVAEAHPERHHQANFVEDSFNFLIGEGLAERIQTHIFDCPGAWSFSWKKKIWELGLKNTLRFFLGKKRIQDKFMVIFDITCKRLDPT